MVANAAGDGFYFTTPLRLLGGKESGSLKVLGWRGRAFTNLWTRPLTADLFAEAAPNGCRIGGAVRGLVRSQDGQRLAITFQPRVELDGTFCLREGPVNEDQVEIVSPEGKLVQRAFPMAFLSPNFKYALDYKGFEVPERIDLATQQRERVPFLARPKGARYNQEIAGISDDGAAFVVREGRLARQKRDGTITTSREFTDCAEDLQGSFQVRNDPDTGKVQLLCVAARGATELWDGEALTKRIVAIGLNRAEFASDGKTILLWSGMAASGDALGGAMHLYGYDIGSRTLQPLLEGTGSVVAADLGIAGTLFAVLSSGEILRRNFSNVGKQDEATGDPPELLHPASFVYAQNELTFGTIWDPIPLDLCCSRLGERGPTNMAPFPGGELPRWTKLEPYPNVVDLRGQHFSTSLPLSAAQKDIGSKQGVLRPSAPSQLELPLRHDVTALAPQLIRNSLRLEPSEEMITNKAVPMGSKVAVLLRGLGGAVQGLNKDVSWPQVPLPLNTLPLVEMSYFCGGLAFPEGGQLIPRQAQTEPGAEGVFRISLDLPNEFPGCPEASREVSAFFELDFSSLFNTLPPEARHSQATQRVRIGLLIRRN